VGFEFSPANAQSQEQLRNLIKELDAKAPKQDA
jgi:hypothetical protein